MRARELKFALISLLFVGLLSSWWLTGCATGNCRQLSEAQESAAAGAAPAQAAAVKAAGTAGEEVVEVGASAKNGAGTKAAQKQGKGAARASTETVVVYKYDGSLQCSMGKAIPVEAMQKELTSAGIKVLKAEKTADGLMHIQVCGQPTGNVNAYTISASQLPEAEKLGFKKWSFE